MSVKHKEWEHKGTYWRWQAVAFIDDVMVGKYHESRRVMPKLSYRLRCAPVGTDNWESVRLFPSLKEAREYALATEQMWDEYMAKQPKPAPVAEAEDKMPSEMWAEVAGAPAQALIDEYGDIKPATKSDDYEEKFTEAATEQPKSKRKRKGK